jgi:Na+/melibiose symporter-like transporter
VIFAVGVFTVIYDLSYQSLLPHIVRTEDLIDANGRLQASYSAAAGIGPLAGGALVQVFTAPVAVLFDAISYIPSALSAIFIRATTIRSAKIRKPFRTELVEGVRALISDSLQLRLTATALTSNFFAAAIQSLLILYAVNSLHLSPLAIGIAFAGNAIGAVLAAVILPWLGRHMSAHLSVMAGLMVDAVGYLAVVLVGRVSKPVDLVVLAIASLLGTAGMVIVGTRAMAWRQQVTPPEMLARVIGATRSLVFGLLPLGALAAGLLADIAGVRIALIVCACGMLSGSLWLATIRKSART